MSLHDINYRCYRPTYNATTLGVDDEIARVTINFQADVISLRYSPDSVSCFEAQWPRGSRF